MERLLIEEMADAAGWTDVDDCLDQPEEEIDDIDPDDQQLADDLFLEVSFVFFSSCCYLYFLYFLFCFNKNKKKEKRP